MQQRKYIKTATVQKELTRSHPDLVMNIHDLYSFFPDEECLEDITVARPPVTPGDMSDKQFEQWLMESPYAIINPSTCISKDGTIDEPALFDVSPFSNTYVHRHPNHYEDIEHSHAFFEMYFVFRGQCSLAIENGRTALRPGDFIIIAPGTRHSVASNGDSFIMGISVRKSDFEDMFRAEQSRVNPLSLFFRNVLFDRTARGYLLFHAGEDEDLRRSLKNMAVESMVRDDYSFMLAHCWLSILLSNLVRMHHLDVEASRPIFDTRISGILQYTQQHYRDVTLDELCERFGYTKSYLCTIIKRTTGSTFSQLLNAQRVKAATTLLHEGCYSVEEVAHRVGYDSVDYFSRRFKREHGVSPAAYRASLH